MEQTQLIKQLELVNILAGVKRYSRDYLVRPDLLLGHLGFCATMAVLVHNDMKKQHNCGDDLRLDLGKLILKATMHDVDEICTGDIVRNVKHHSPESVDMFKILEEKGIDQLDQYLESEGRNSIRQFWSTAKESSELEGVLVKVIDFLAVVYKAWDEYYLCSNLHFQRVLFELRDSLVKNDFSRLCDGITSLPTAPSNQLEKVKEYMSQLTTSCLVLLNTMISDPHNDQLRSPFGFLEAR